MAARYIETAVLLTSAVLAACGNSADKSAPTPTRIPPASATREVIPTAIATATPKVIITPFPTLEPPKPLTDQEINAASAQMEQTRAIIDAFMPRPLIQKYTSSALSDLPPVNDPSYKRAAERWSRFVPKDESGRSMYRFGTGPDGKLRYQITVGKPGESTTIVVNLFDPLSPTNAGDFIPEISFFYGNETVKDPKGNDVRLQFRQEGLPGLARTLFNLPDGLTLQQTTSRLEGGMMIPAVEGHFNSPQGRVTVNVNAFGTAGMVITR